ncbi:MAG: glycosyltransferase family 39 protein, partial [Actinomycetota bacterium]|nr:glycosyltransferase family 39 protein [Actinomycetota bacterium]
MTSLAQPAVPSRRWLSSVGVDTLALVAVLVLGAGLRFWGLGAQSFWYDEIATTVVIKGSFWHVFTIVDKQEATPPLYYVLAWIWTRVGGVTETGVRSLSAVAGVATIWFTWAATREAISARAGVLAAAVVAVNPMLIWYSQEARAFALLTLLASMSFWLCVRAWHRPTRGSLAAWSAVCCLVLVTHYFGVFIVVAELCALLWLLPGRRRDVGFAFAPVVLAGLALLPLAHAQESNGRTAWIGGMPIGGRVGHVLRELVSANASLIDTNAAPPGGHWGTLGVVGVLLGLGLVLATPQARAHRGVRVAAIVGLLAIAIPLALSLTPLDYFFDRNVIAAWIPVAIAFGGGLALARPKLLALAALAAVVVAGVGVTAKVERTPALQRTGWRAVSRLLGRPGLAREVVVNPAYDAAALEFYGQGLIAMPAGARIQELDVVVPGGALDQAPPPGFVATLRAASSGVAVLRFRAPKPLTVTQAAIASAGQPVLLELSSAGTRWIQSYVDDLAAWGHALSNIDQGPGARAVLAAAPGAAHALAVVPAEI